MYTNKKSNWINEVEDNEIQPYVIQRWLTMNDMLRVQTRWLDKYVFHLPPKMYLSLAWSILPKVQKTPFVKYIKKKEVDTEFNFIIPKIRKHFCLSDNDFDSLKHYIVSAIKSDTVNWFKYYGVEKKYWKKYYLDFRLMKQDEDKATPVKSLGDWGM